MTPGFSAGERMTRPTNVARARAKLAGMVPAPARAEATAVKYGYARVSTDGRLMLTVLGGLAEFEGELIRAHCGRPGADQGERQELGSAVQAHRPPAARGAQAPSSR
jgi:hypothetical protein